jgi:predicted nucleic acid-binding protein
VHAFDADVLIYAAVPGHPLGSRVRALFAGAAAGSAPPVGIGSTLLLPELLAKPTRDAAEDEVKALAWLLARLELRPLDPATALLAVVLAASYSLRSADAMHLATAVNAGADRFLTNNRRDFPSHIAEIDIVYPGDLLDHIDA